MKATRCLHILLGLLLVVFSNAQTIPVESKAALLQSKLACGSFEGRTRQALFLHRQASRRSAERTLLARKAEPRKRTFGAGTPTGTAANGAEVNPMFIPLNPFDLDNRTLTFTPDNAQSTSYRYALEGAPFDVSKAGTGSVRLPLSDDDSYRVQFPFPFTFYGKDYREVNVNTNGHLTFVAPDASYRNLTFGAFEQGVPRISPAMVDLFPDFSGDQVGVFLYTTPGSVIITWKDVPLFDSFFVPNLDPISLQVELFADGRIRYAYREVDEGAYLVGISPGSAVSAEATFVDFTEETNRAISTGIVEVFSDYPELDIVEATKQFYTRLRDYYNYPLSEVDSYDVIVFLTVYPGPAGPGAIAYNVPVRNKVKGIGLDTFDYGEDFGSPSRLKAVINMGSIYQYPLDTGTVIPGYSGSGDTMETIFAHEFGHMFLAYPRLSLNGETTESLLGRQSAHWSFNFNSDGSFLEGNRLEQVGFGDPGVFRTTGLSEKYSELDLYLMGFLGPESVGKTQELFYVADSNVPSTNPTKKGSTIEGRKVPFTINDVIAAVGPRVPSHIYSTKRFKVGFVYVDTNGFYVQPQGPGHLLPDLSKLMNHVEQAIGVEGLFTDYPRKGLQPQPVAGIPLGKEVIFGNYEPGTGGVYLRNGWDGKQLKMWSEGGVLEHVAAIPKPPDNQPLYAKVKAVREGPGILRIQEFWSDEYPVITEQVQVRVLDPSKLRLKITSGNRQQVGPGSAATNNVGLRVVDDLDIPYRELTVKVETTTGGFMIPESKISDDFGNVSFQWIVGDQAENHAIAYIDGFKETTSIVLTTVPDKRVQAGAATNGASFAVGLTPGSLATLFGVNLAAGSTAEATTLPLPLSLEGVSLRVNGERVRLLYVGPGQINFYVPEGLTGDTVTVEVTTPDGKSNTVQAPLQPVAPGIFYDSGTNIGAVLASGTGQKTNLRPAMGGEYVEIFATGLGAVTLSPDNPNLWITSETPEVLLDGTPIPVVFSGLAPGFVGLNQVNAQIPEGTAAGEHTLEIRIGGVTSNSVKIVVQ